MKNKIAWRTLLEAEDYLPIIQRIKQAIPHYQLYRGFSDTSEKADMPYDFFLYLLEEGPFAYYLEHPEFSDASIDERIFSLNLNNFLTKRLRKLQPEGFRLARRISKLLASCRTFREFSNGSGGKYIPLALRVYGLSRWEKNKPIKDQNLFPSLVKKVGVRLRDTRRVGCTGDADIVISNEELHHLLIEVFEALDSPCRIETLRPLVQSKTGCFVVGPLELDHEEDSLQFLDRLASESLSPEEIMKSSELKDTLSQLCVEVLDRQCSRYRQSRAAETKTARLLKALWMMYFGRQRLNQKRISEKLKVSDSLVSEWKGRFERDVRSLGLPLSQLRIFNDLIREELKRRISRLS